MYWTGRDILHADFGTLTTYRTEEFKKQVLQVLNYSLKFNV